MNKSMAPGPIAATEMNVHHSQMLGLFGAISRRKFTSPITRPFMSAGVDHRQPERTTTVVTLRDLGVERQGLSSVCAAQYQRTFKATEATSDHAKNREPDRGGDRAVHPRRTMTETTISCKLTILVPLVANGHIGWCLIPDSKLAGLTIWNHVRDSDRVGLPCITG